MAGLGAGLSRRTVLKAGAAALGLAGTAALSGCAKEEIKVETVSGELESLWLYNPSGVRQDGQYVDKQLKTTMDATGIIKPPLAATSNARVETVVVSAAAAYEEITDLFYKRGWTDGLPIIPPHELKMSKMCKGTDLPREVFVATMPPLMGQATVEKIAANAVMAGCRPEYLPVLLAAVEGVCDDAYDLVGASTTTSPNASMILVNGPIADALKINSGANCFGRGHKANATIGRALHLCEQNIGGAWPRVSDFSSLGMPGDYSWMFAENEAESPWEPYHVQQGFAPEQNVVTVMSGAGMQLLVDIDLSNEEYVQRVARHIALSDRANRAFLVVMPPFTAQDLAAEGWTRESIAEVVTEEWNRTHPDAPQDHGVDVRIVVAGGVGEKNYIVPLWRTSVSREVRLPKDWDVYLTYADE